jgi:hypothetical protein
MKIMTGILALALVLGLALALPMSADARFRGTINGFGPNYRLGTGSGPGFVDEDGDGVCDWRQDIQTSDQVTRGQYGEFVDADGDGVCDNYADRPLDGTGFGITFGYRGGR